MGRLARFKELDASAKIWTMLLHTTPGIVMAPLGVASVEKVQKVRGRKMTQRQKVFGYVSGAVVGGAMGHIAYRSMGARAAKHWHDFKGPPGKGQWRGGQEQDPFANFRKRWGTPPLVGLEVDKGFAFFKINPKITTKVEVKTAIRKWLRRNHPDSGNLDDIGDIARRTKITRKAIIHKDNIYRSPAFLKMAGLLDPRASIALKLGALAVMAYSIAMQISLHNKVISEFEKPQNFSLKHIDPAIRAKVAHIQNIDDFNDWADENISNAWTRFWVKQQAKAILREPTNAAFVLGDIPDRPVILSHFNQRNTKVQAHELGHYIDALQQGALTRKGYDKVYGESRSHLRSLFGDPKETSLYKAEERAWENVGIKAGDPMREKALATYEYDLRKNRYTLPAVAALWFG